MEDTTEDIFRDKPQRTVLTGIADTDLIVLSKLREKDLLRACVTNKAINKACKNEAFWKDRFIETYDNAYPPKLGYDYANIYKKDNETWRNFYLKFAKYTDDFINNFDLLIKACSIGDMSLVVYALNAIASDVNARQGIVLMTAVIENHEQIIKYLISHGAIVTGFIFSWMCAHCSYEIIEYAIRQGVEINYDDNLPLRKAAQQKRWDIVKLLISLGANMHAKDDEILIHAASYGDVKFVKFLLDNGANINRGTYYKNKPLYRGVSSGNPDMVKYLLDRGAENNINFVWEAVNRGKLEIVKILVEKGGIDINATPALKNGELSSTPLELAKKLKEYEIYQYLRQHGASQ